MLWLLICQHSSILDWVFTSLKTSIITGCGWFPLHSIHHRLTHRCSTGRHGCNHQQKYQWWEKEWLVGATPSTWNFGSTDPRWSEIANFEQIITRSTSAVTPSEKSSINTNRKFTTCFPMSQRWSSYVVPKSPKGGLKTQNGRFSSKIALRLKKVCYKVSLCENCQRPKL